MIGSRLTAKPFIAALALSGCASWQLNRNTVDLATSSSDLVTNQVISNLAKFRADAFAIPSQVSIPSGSATTTNSITPTISIPIGVSATTALANAAAAPLFLAGTRTHVMPNTTLGGSAADQWSQNWTLAPLQDPDQLRRLRALYRFGAGQTDKAQFACEYPLVQKAPDSSATQSSDGKAGPTIIYTKKECANDNVGTPDPAFLRPPGCIFCETQPGAILDVRKTAIKAKLLKRTKQITFSPPISESEAEQFKGRPVSGLCIPAATVITSIDSSSRTMEISNNPTCDGEKIDLSIIVDAKKFQITATLTNNATITFSPPISESEVERFVGQPISGLCIPAATVITSIDSSTQMEISRTPTCKGPHDLSVTVAEKSLSRTLVINYALQNDWLWNPANVPTLAPNAPPLGLYGGQELYLSPSESSQKEFSDFVLFVLEATLQSNSSSGGPGSTKGTPQKGGPTPLLQEPASPAFQLQ